MTHLLLAAGVVALTLLTAMFVPRGKQVGFLIVALGYLSLLLIFVTLLIGPLNLLRFRRNPLNIELARPKSLFGPAFWVQNILYVHLLILAAC